MNPSGSLRKAFKLFFKEETLNHLCDYKDPREREERDDTGKTGKSHSSKYLRRPEGTRPIPSEKSGL